MPRVTNLRTYIKLEAFGKWNTGKTYLLYSFAWIKPYTPQKKTIVLFTNEATYAETLDKPEFREYKKNFDIYQHRSLEEFEHDWDCFLEDYKVTTEPDKQGRLTISNYDYVEKNVHAVLFDEGEFIYRAYIERHKDALKQQKVRWHPKYIGTPRHQFRASINRMAVLPCHFGIVSKVGDEYESFREEKTNKELGALQFRKTGRDKYRLPDDVLYLPSISFHLFRKDDPIYESYKDKGQTYQIQSKDELGRPIFKGTFYGETRKNKADREHEIIMRNPTIPKVMLRLRKMASENQ